MMAKALAKMERAGFKIEVLPDHRLNIKGQQPLSEEQRQWITQNKLQIMSHLLAMTDSNVKMLVDLFDAKIVNVIKITK